MESDVLALRWNDHLTVFSRKLSSMRYKGLYADVTLACEEKFYSAHRLILSTCSEYFGAIFEQTLCKTCKTPVIVLKDITSKDLEFLLDYMYLGEVNVKQAELGSLIKAAEYLKIKGLAVPDDDCESNEKESKYSKAIKHFSNKDISSPNPKKQKIKHHTYDNILSPIYTSSDENITKVNDGEHKNTNNSFQNETKHNEEILFIKEEPNDGNLNEENVRIKPDYDDSLNSSYINFQEHISTQINDQQFIDEISNLTNMNSDQLNEIDSSEDLNTSLIECSSPQQHPLQRTDHENSHHQELHWKKEYPCHYCGRIFGHTTNLHAHLRTHTGEKPFHCMYCDYRTTLKGNLKMHIIAKHQAHWPSVQHLVKPVTESHGDE